MKNITRIIFAVVVFIDLIIIFLCIKLLGNINEIEAIELDFLERVYGLGFRPELNLLVYTDHWNGILALFISPLLVALLSGIYFLVKIVRNEERIRIILIALLGIFSALYFRNIVGILIDGLDGFAITFPVDNLRLAETQYSSLSIVKDFVLSGQSKYSGHLSKMRINANLIVFGFFFETILLFSGLFLNRKRRVPPSASSQLLYRLFHF